MSLQSVVWAIEDAPDVPPQLVSTLIAIANHAGRDGTAAYPSTETVAHYTRKSKRQAQRDIDALEERGLIRRGDQRFVLHLRPDQRPVVWDLAMELTRQRGDTHDIPLKEYRGDTHDANGVTPMSPKQSLEPKEDKTLGPADDAGQLGLDIPGSEAGVRGKPKLRSAKAPAGGKSGCPAPDDLEITLEMRQWFRDQGLAKLGVDGKHETQQFLDHHRAKGTKFKRWDLAWRTWMRNAGKYAQQRAGKPGEPGKEQRRGEHGEQVLVNGRWVLDRSALPASDWRRFSDQ